jgi:hypothetical protein
MSELRNPCSTVAHVLTQEMGVRNEARLAFEQVKCQVKTGLAKVVQICKTSVASNPRQIQLQSQIML